MNLKRLFDVIFSVCALIVLLPFFALIAAGIKATSAGPVIFRQRRTGFMQREFVIFKFRTMYHGTGRPGVDLISPHDPRITPFGRLLRKTRLDETPQFFNVLKDEMSVVGPRPYEFHSTKLLLEHEPKTTLRFTVLPGITGLAQVRGRNGKTLEHMAIDIIHDLEYTRRRSFGFDCRILLWTFLVILKRKGV